MLKLQNIHIGYEKSKKKYSLFKEGNLELKEGEFVGIFGPNGSGKTTFFDTLLGTQNALSGDVLFQDRNMKNISKMEKVKMISAVPSKFLGVNYLSVYELIAMGRAPYTNILNQLTQEDKQIVSTTIAQLNLEKLVDKNTYDLSDGERQIAMIGKALAQETSVIILDEPTAFLDYNNRRKVLQLLSEITKQKNKLILISSHDLDLCFEYCTRIIAIDNNKKELINFLPPYDKEEIIERVF